MNQDNDNLPLVIWTIPSFDERRDIPFMIRDQEHVLRWDMLSESQVAEMRQIIGRKETTVNASKTLDPSVPSVQLSISLSVSLPDDRVLAYRQYFERIEEDEMIQLMRGTGSYAIVHTQKEYFEDRNGHEINRHRMRQLALRQ